MQMETVVTATWKACVAAVITCVWVRTAFYAQHFLSEPVRPGTVVSVMFLIVVLSATHWGVAPSLAASFSGAFCYVTYFQPPFGKFAATPQGWLAAGSFVVGSLFLGRLSGTARRSAAEAIRHSRESDLVERFARGLLACSNSQLVASTAVNEAVELFGASAAAFEFALGAGSHRSGPAGWEWSIPEPLRKQALEHGDWIRDSSREIVVIPLVLERTLIAHFGFQGADMSDLVVRTISRQLLMTLGRVLAAEQLLQLAGEIQMGLLPKNFPGGAGATDVDVFATIIPAQDVGGDFYHYFLLDPDHLCFAIGDVSDKGIPAALFMAMTVTAWVVSEKEGGRALPESIRSLNRYLCENNQSQMFVTLYAGILNLQTGAVEYCDGGHEPPFVVHGGARPELAEKKGGLALGVDPDYPYQSGTLQLAPGDTLFLYTDGVNEAKNVAGQFFKVGGIEAVLAKNGTTNCEHMCNAVMKALGQFVSGAPQSDDITMLALSYRRQCCGQDSPLHNAPIRQ